MLYIPVFRLRYKFPLPGLMEPYLYTDAGHGMAGTAELLIN
jgi:hypothetical protein